MQQGSFSGNSVWQAIQQFVTTDMDFRDSPIVEFALK
jgi:hypothetical protein